MEFFVLVTLLVLLALLAPRYGADSRVDGDRWVW
jgi:hypothetical protein